MKKAFHVGAVLLASLYMFQEHSLWFLSIDYFARFVGVVSAVYIVSAVIYLFPVWLLTLRSKGDDEHRYDSYGFVAFVVSAMSYVGKLVG